MQESISEDDKILNPNIDPGRVDVDQYDRERNLMEQREKELAAPKIKELKIASLEFLDQWRLNVMERVGSIMNSKEVASSQMESAPAQKETTHSPVDSKVNPESSSPDDAAAGFNFSELYPPISTPLTTLDEPTRLLILHSTLLLLLSLEHYVAHSRVLLLYITSSLRLPLHALISDEEKVAVGLLEAAKHISADTEAQKKAEENQQSRKWKVGLASVAGAAIIGVTGGLAAPLVAAGVGSVMGGLGLGATAAAGYLGSVAGSTILVGGLFGAYGGKMTGQMMDSYAREVEDFAFLPVRESLTNIDKEAKQAEKDKSKELAEDKRGRMNSEGGVDQGLESERKPSTDRGDIPKSKADEKSPTKDHTEQEHLSDEQGAVLDDPGHRRLRVTIGITGWLTSKEEVVTPWRVLGAGSEVFALRWELEALLNLGNSITTMISSTAWGYAKSEMIKRTIFAELMSAMWPVALLQVSRVVDNPFSVARARAEKAGEVLADALLNKAQGERPVTLIGYSLGARVIYTCLMSLAKRRAFGLIESVVLIGAPTPSTTSDWRVMRSVVSNRLVNVYSANDYVLGFLYRTSSIQFGVAGLQKIEGLPSVENIDVSETVSGHLRYRYLVGSILQKIGFEGLQINEVEREQEALKKMDEEERIKKLLDQSKEVSGKVLEDGGKAWGKLPAAGTGGKSKEGAREQGKDEAERETSRMEREVREKTEKGLIQRMREGLYIGSK
jgi:hypothetical protein